MLVVDVGKYTDVVLNQYSYALSGYSLVKIQQEETKHVPRPSILHCCWSFLVELNVTIAIQYNPPTGVTIRPPDYSPATPVSLRCEASGGSGSVSYQWNSTCNSCFVSGTSQTQNQSYLWSYDAGEHTCVATDGRGYTSSASTRMTIIG